MVVSNKEYVVVEDVRLAVWLIEMADLIDELTPDRYARQKLLLKLREIKEVLE